MKVLAIVPYQLDYCAGQRFRIELWDKELIKRGIEIEYLCYTDKALTDVLYKPKNYFKKSTLMLSLFAKQLINVLNAKKPNLIFLYREAALIGPPIIEKILRKWDIPIIYDIDEPLFVTYSSPTNGIFNSLRFISKISKLMKMSDSVFSVNQAIAKYAVDYNNDIEIVPMSVDTKRYSPAENIKKDLNAKPIITWVGTRSNQININLAVEPLRKINKKHSFVFRIIADEPMLFEGLEVEFIPWTFDNEVPRLQEAQIGIVPVMESVWSPWKFFFKTVQFMSLGMPIVASAVGSNLEIIKDGFNGFLVKNEQEWEEKIQLLLENESLRLKLGQNARKTALAQFDIENQYDFIEKKFKSMAKV
jgi:glycosyltransferase involved in cell wall biosynthesis